MADTVSEAVKYFYVIQGAIPELMPNVLYRRCKPAVTVGRKAIKCPICNQRLTYVDIDTPVELYQHPVRVQVKCQFYMKCLCCKREIGINIARLNIA